MEVDDKGKSLASLGAKTHVLFTFFLRWFSFFWSREGDVQHVCPSDVGKEQNEKRKEQFNEKEDYEEDEGGGGEMRA